MMRWKCQNRQKFDNDKRRSISGSRCPAKSSILGDADIKFSTMQFVMRWSGGVVKRKTTAPWVKLSTSADCYASNRVDFHIALVAMQTHPSLRPQCTSLPH